MGTTKACPAPITGTITSARTGNRIELQIALSGPKGIHTAISVMLDTGGIEDYFPNALLHSLAAALFLAREIHHNDSTACFYHKLLRFGGLSKEIGSQ